MPDPKVPEDTGQIGAWLVRNVMRPSMPLSVIACREHRTGHELDVLALARGSRPRTPGSPIAFIGGAKHRYRRPGMAELRSLEHARDLLIAAGHDTSAATICLFSGTGFTDDLAAEAARSHARILLVGLEFLYGIQDRLG